MRVVLVFQLTNQNYLSLLSCINELLRRLGMSSLATKPVLATAVECTDHEIIVALSDGCTLSVPIVWFLRLANATPSESADYEFLGNGESVHWAQVDEDVSVSGLLAGRPSVEFDRNAS